MAAKKPAKAKQETTGGETTGGKTTGGKTTSGKKKGKKKGTKKLSGSAMAAMQYQPVAGPLVLSPTDARPGSGRQA